MTEKDITTDEAISPSGSPVEGWFDESCEESFTKKVNVLEELEKARKRIRDGESA